MRRTGDLSPDALYRRGLEHFSRGEWRSAIDAFTAVQALSDAYPDTENLIADAQLKMQFEGAGQPTAMAPPRRPLLLPLLALLALLIAGGVGFTVYELSSTPPPEVAVVPTAVPPTATPRPTIQPTAVPPTATPEPTAVAVLPATLQISATDQSVFVTTPRNIEIIFDGSGSMRRKVAGTELERWQVAQEALRAFVSSGAISGQTNVALRTYGRQRASDCGDYEIVQNLALFNQEALLSVVGTLVPVPGARTPLAFSIRAAADDLRPAEGSTALIVVTDGDETCDGDPAAESAAFVANVGERKVHVIGFALDTPGDEARLRQIALNGNGLYFDATNGAELAAALRQTIQLSYSVVAADGTQAGSGTVGGDAVTLAPGSYTVRINATPPFETTVEVGSGATVKVDVEQDGGGLRATVRE